jgi:hypothetical protein
VLILRLVLIHTWHLLARLDRMTHFSLRLVRPLIAYLERRILGKKLAPQQLLLHMSRGGLRALDDRSAIHPAIAVFAVVDDERALVQAFGRPDVSREVLDELGMYLTECIHDYFESDDDRTPTQKTTVPDPPDKP